MRRATTSSIEHFFLVNRQLKALGSFIRLLKKPKINSDDFKRMQYIVLKQQNKKLEMETMYFRLMNKKLRKELGLPNED